MAPARSDGSVVEAWRRKIYDVSSALGFEFLAVLACPSDLTFVDDSSPRLELSQGRRGLILPILEWSHLHIA